MSMSTDEQLMLDVRRGSRAAFELIFERYRGPVWRFYRRRVPDPARAEELTQDAFVALLEGAVRYQPRGAFRSYLFGIAYNILHSDRRRTSRRELVPLEADRLSITGDGDAGIWVRQALDELDADDREILMLREYEQLSYQEIADLRKLPLNTVRSRLFRARMALRALLDRPAPVSFDVTRVTQGES
jgi:RNA polymerase sigma-70 factor (ECF subfamily)